MTLKHLILPLLPFALSACAGHSPEAVNAALSQSRNAIMGGQEAGAGSRESLSLVMVTNHLDNFICSGSLVAENLVLTAAHCVGSDPRFTKVVFSLSPFTAEADERAVLDHRKHELHRMPGMKERSDLAVLRFEGHAPAGARIAELPGEAEKISLGGSFTAIGYGRTDGRLNDFVEDDGLGVLRFVNIQARSWRIPGKEFVASQASGKGVCIGDSGGPAMRWREDGTPLVLGIASGVYYEDMVDQTPPDFDFCRGVSLYVETTSYADWILNAMTELGFKPGTEKGRHPQRGVQQEPVSRIRQIFGFDF